MAGTAEWLRGLHGVSVGQFLEEATGRATTKASLPVAGSTPAPRLHGRGPLRAVTRNDEAVAESRVAVAGWVGEVGQGVGQEAPSAPPAPAAPSVRG